MSNIIQFGEKVAGYKIPVLNEREIRASAGILFLFVFMAFLRCTLVNDFIMLKYFVSFFLVDFIIRIFINPRFSPTLILGRWIVSRQVPEYVGAAQKKFAWIIGLILATTIFVHLVVFNKFSPIVGISCLLCQIFLFFESAFGICLGCLVYGWIYRKKAQYCPGESCDPKAKHAIQKISGAQVLIVLCFIVLMGFALFYFNNSLSIKPAPLWDFMGSTKQK